MVYQVAKLVLNPYDPVNPIFFDHESGQLLKRLKWAEAHHIGSSAVPGLFGKNTLDILLLFKTKKEAKRSFSALLKLSYVERGQKSETGKRPRFFFKKDVKFRGKKRYIHLHIMWKTNSFYRRYFLFRDYLRLFPKEAKRYAALKEKWLITARKKKTDEHDVRVLYSNLKTTYVKKVLKKAEKKFK